jgi:hypothetical protein
MGTGYDKGFSTVLINPGGMASALNIRFQGLMRKFAPYGAYKLYKAIQ